MHRLALITILTVSLLKGAAAQHRDSLIFGGQASAWINFNPDQKLSLNSGVRYIPQLNYELSSGNRKFDVEFSLNLNANTGIRPFDSLTGNAAGKPYRAWLRYSGRQFEVRLGLQKINFGSAQMLRPLMWFDQVDPRDPLQLTDGVWGLLGRYYFLNNANIWLWVLYPSDKPKTWEFTGTNAKIPEAGGRLQLPVFSGEIGLSYHHRITDTRENPAGFRQVARMPENRIGIDGRWDAGAGLWFEATHTGLHDFGELTQQDLLTLGMDYTFGIGNGLNIIAENLIAATGEKAFRYKNSLAFTGVTLSYPLSITGNISTIVYFDWENRNAYSFVNYKKLVGAFQFYLMAYYNPETYLIPAQASENNYFAGKGIQIMMVYTH
ncbi:MAG: hypothetical protein M9926_02955 [Lentimicrobium sp.]|jgi:hypothetical protein|uniref:hypothetical protein n=1 Tax=Lentimicrobium sp. TaxID=2034841 RepID=UPI0025F05C53|nr:hypothetical protein [Lentimicrobium sp.]MCO5255693.1 hypothetical protein [Lentimicrobium sp.]